MRARTISLGIVALVALLGLLSIIVPRIKGESRPASPIPGVALPGLHHDDDTTGAYCDRISAQRNQLADIFSASDSSALVDNLGLFQSLAEGAPSDIAGSWTAFNTAIGSLKSAIAASGHSAQDFAGGEMPAGLTPQQRDAVRNAASTLTSPVTVAAAASIEQEVRDVCKIDLGM